MNLGDIKSASTEKVPVDTNKVAPDKSASATENQALKQLAAEQVSLSNNARTVATARILQTNFDQNVVFKGQQEFLADLTARPKPSNQPFDFEEVADNVLNFIGGALKLAKENGADDEKLTEMFEQARKGVEKGISQARKDLAGFMNEELDEGINKSFDAIRRGLDDLEREYFGKDEEVTAAGVSQSIAAEREDSSELTLTTKDGDEVTISFASVRGFEANQAAAVQQSTSSTEDGTETNVQVGVSQSYEFYQSERFSFSVEGDLSQEEIDDIAKFVEETSGLVDDFFNGDIKSAFQQASEIGLEDSQIAGFALELSRTETVETVQQYQQVSSYNEDENPGGSKPAIKTVSEYLNNLLQSLEDNDKIFGRRESFDELVNGLISEVENIKTPQLVEAFNEFRSFNQRLLNAIPGESSTTGDGGNSANEQA
jgi:hypothetical protein